MKENMTNCEVSTIAISTAVESLYEIIGEAKTLFSDHAESFVEDHIGVLARGLSVYSSLFQTAAVTDRTELFKVIKHGGPEIQEAADQLLAAEDEWLKFISEVDASLEIPADVLFLKENDHLPMDFKLQPVTAESVNVEKTFGEIVSQSKHVLLVVNRFLGWHPWRLHVKDLTDRKEELSSIGLDVIILSFGLPEDIQHWIKETNCIFPMFSDLQRNYYKALNLRKSVKQVWSVSTLCYYGAEMLKTSTLPKHVEKKQDPHQLGGDFIIDSEGKLVCIFRQKSPSDRPSVDYIIESFNKCQGQ